MIVALIYLCNIVEATSSDVDGSAFHLMGIKGPSLFLECVLYFFLKTWFYRYVGPHCGLLYILLTFCLCYFVCIDLEDIRKNDLSFGLRWPGHCSQWRYTLLNVVFAVDCELNALAFCSPLR